MRSVLSIGLAAPVLLLAACASAGGNAPQTQSPDMTSTMSRSARAQPGDTVYLVRHYVRPERRDHFEDFLRTVLLPALGQSTDPSWQHVRVFRPTQPEEDGALRYTFVLDPYVSGQAYDLVALLSSVHGQEEALRQYNRFTEMWARDFTAHAFVVSR